MRVDFQELFQSIDERILKPFNKLTGGSFETESGSVLLNRDPEGEDEEGRPHKRRRQTPHIDVAAVPIISGLQGDFGSEAAPVVMAALAKEGFEIWVRAWGGSLHFN